MGKKERLQAARAAGALVRRSVRESLASHDPRSSGQC